MKCQNPFCGKNIVFLFFFFFFFRENRYSISCTMSPRKQVLTCQNLFSGINKKNIINLSSSELAQRVIKVKAPFKIVTRAVG